MTPRGARPAPERQPQSEAVSVQARSHSIGAALAIPTRAPRRETFVMTQPR